MSVFFSSDWHLGHKLAADKRGFQHVPEHDWTIISNMETLSKRDKLFLLGDIAYSMESMELLSRLRCDIDIVLGNHDRFKSEVYLKWARRVEGMLKYKKFWVTHCPIHPQEMYRVRANIHGHIHRGAATPDLDWPYFNVNVDFHNYEPVPFDTIDAWAMSWERRRSGWMG